MSSGRRPTPVKSRHVDAVADAQMAVALIGRLETLLKMFRSIRDNGPRAERAGARKRIEICHVIRDRLDALLIQARILEAREEATELDEELADEVA